LLSWNPYPHENPGFEPLSDSHENLPELSSGVVDILLLEDAELGLVGPGQPLIAVHRPVDQALQFISTGYYLLEAVASLSSLIFKKHRKVKIKIKMNSRKSKICGNEYT
jgi:hypothetical protein